MHTICDLFTRNVEAAPDRTVVHHAGANVTFGQIASQAHAIAGRLRAEGLESGDRVVMLLPNSAEYVACYLGIMQAGGIVVALNSDTTADEVRYAIADCAPYAVIVGGRASAVLAEAAAKATSTEDMASVCLLIHAGDRPSEPLASQWQSARLSEVVGDMSPSRPISLNPSDPAQIIYTSGTTGRPKGVTLTHRNITACCQSIISYLQLTSDDSVFVTLPFFYSYGNSLLFTHLACGGRLVIASDFVFWNRALDQAVEQRVTGFAGVPSSFAMLLHRSDFATRRFPDLRYMTCAGGRIAPAVVDRIRSSIPHVQFFLMYGQTEATTRLSVLLPQDIDRKPGSVGRAIPGVSLSVLNDRGEPVQVGEIGEIVARGENVMRGYWNAPAETAAVLRPDGLHTGDLARIDDEGYIYIVGRQNDLIKSGAYRINPQEIEDSLLRHPGVAEVAVIGVPDEILAEKPVAYVVPSPNGPQPSEPSLLEHCRKHLPRYKCVRAVQFVDYLPKTASGKIRRTVLRDAALAESQL